MRYSTKPNNNPKELINSMTKMKGHPIVSLRLTPDLHRMVFINANSTIVVFDFDTNKILKVKLEVQPTVLQMVPGRDLCLTCDTTNKVRLYHTVSLQEQQHPMPELGQVIEATTSPNHLAFACQNGIVFVIEIRDLSKVKCKLESYSTSACVSVDFDPTVELVVVAGQTDGTLTTWGHASSEPDMIQKTKLPYVITAVRYSNERVIIVQSDRTFYKIDS